MRAFLVKGITAGFCLIYETYKAKNIDYGKIKKED